MTPTDALALGRRAVAAGFVVESWMALLFEDDDGALRESGRSNGRTSFRSFNDRVDWTTLFPDLRDPYTAAAVGAWARERLGDPDAYCLRASTDLWTAVSGVGGLLGHGTSRAEAWLAAVERKGNPDA